MKIETKSGAIIIAGYVARDAEYKLAGSKNTPMTRFGVAVAKGADGRSEFVNCVAWREWADATQGIKAGCYVMAAGTVAEREYNGKTYRDLNVEFVTYFDPAAALADRNAKDMAGMTPVDPQETGDGLPF